MLRSDFCEYSDAYIAVKGRKTVEGTVANNKTNRLLAFKNNAPLCCAYQKSITHLQPMQKILILLCRCIICWNIVKIIL